MVDAAYYAILGVAGFAALGWTLLSMGVIKPRDHSLHVEREKHHEHARHCIDATFEIMEAIPAVNRDNIRSHLDKGEYTRALEVAQIHHDVFHFFKNY